MERPTRYSVEISMYGKRHVPGGLARKRKLFMHCGLEMHLYICITTCKPAPYNVRCHIRKFRRLHYTKGEYTT